VSADVPGSTVTAGVRFGAYRLEERLGAGGLSVVWRAVLDGPERFARTVALKRLSPELSRNPAFAQMLVTEARVSALLHHPAIAQVQDFGQVDGEYFIIMELVEGVDLARVLKACAATGILPPIGVVTQIVAQLAAALAYVHELADADGRPLEIVHRDVSPSNVMITHHGDIKLIDFGIARAAGHFRDDKTATGLLKGKIGYLSPEQAAGRPADRRSDIFALGVVMYEMLCVRRLFRGVDALDTLRLVREAEVTPPSLLREEIPGELETIVMRMLARDSAHRYQSCQEIVRALRPVLHAFEGDSTAVHAFVSSFPATALAEAVREDTPATAAIESPSPSLASVSPAVSPQLRSGNGRGLIVVVALAATAAAATALAFWLRGSEPTLAPPKDAVAVAKDPLAAPRDPVPKDLAPRLEPRLEPKDPAPKDPDPVVAQPTASAAKAQKSSHRDRRHHGSDHTPSVAPTKPVTKPTKPEELPELQRPFQ